MNDEYLMIYKVVLTISRYYPGMHQENYEN